MSEALFEHLRSGVTTVCRAWRLTRKDGVVFGFTDHDRPLTFEDTEFRASGGLTAASLQQTTGLSVDNSEVLGAFQDDVIAEADIDAGVYDAALVECWRLNWKAVEQRQLIFRAAIGQITRRDGAFQAELRGLTDMLNQPQGRSYYREYSPPVSANACGMSKEDPTFVRDVEVLSVADNRVLWFDTIDRDLGWFERGTLQVLSGAAEGLAGLIRYDLDADGQRRIELWQSLVRTVAPGDQVRLIAGCNGITSPDCPACGSVLNSRSFPFIPGDDWLVSVPVRGDANDGGSLYR
ncbi:MAG: DUF2163 domain-containing protein [Pseudomonadota bacterium]